MTISLKVFLLIATAIYLIYNVFLALHGFYGRDRVITVKERMYSDSISPIKTLRTEGHPIYEFQVRVKANDFWDVLLLTGEDENLLCSILKITAAMTLGWYAIVLTDENIVSRRVFRIFRVFVTLALLASISYYGGEFHTRMYWETLYQKKTSNIFDSQKEYLFSYWLYIYLPAMAVQYCYRDIVNHKEGKVKEGIFG